jgi:hypothetical protein
MENIFKSLKSMPFNIMEHNPQPRGFSFSCKHTEESKQLIRELKMGTKQTQEHIQNRVNSVKGFKQSEHQKNKARETFEMAWLLTNNQGQSFNIVNLRKFCLQNQLDQGNMVKVSQGKLKQHKGWKCTKIGA